MGKKGTNYCSNLIFIFEKSVSLIFLNLFWSIIFLKYSIFFLILRSPKAPLKFPTKRRNGNGSSRWTDQPKQRPPPPVVSPNSEHWTMADPPLAKQVWYFDFWDNWIREKIKTQVVLENKIEHKIRDFIIFDAAKIHGERLISSQKKA